MFHYFPSSVVEETNFDKAPDFFKLIGTSTLYFVTTILDCNDQVACKDLREATGSF